MSIVLFDFKLTLTGSILFISSAVVNLILLYPYLIGDKFKICFITVTFYNDFM